MPLILPYIASFSNTLGLESTRLWFFT